MFGLPEHQWTTRRIRLCRFQFYRSVSICRQ
nr:MAG TPA: hypothetical protein [Caudoviricetes sp.]